MPLPFIIKPPADERAENKQWREYLNKGLREAFQRAKREVGMAATSFMVGNTNELTQQIPANAFAGESLVQSVMRSRQYDPCHLDLPKIDLHA